MVQRPRRAPAKRRHEPQQPEASCVLDDGVSILTPTSGSIEAPSDVATKPSPESSSVLPELESACALVVPATVALSAWHSCGVAVTGLSHRRKGLPCQDAVAWGNQTRPILVLSDGAGSAAISERGAAELVRGMSRFLMTMEDALSAWLDEGAGIGEKQADLWSRRVLTHAQGLLADLAYTERRSVRDVRATLLLAVLGTTYTYWWQVGDGSIVAQSASRLQVLGNTAKAKGEFANQTCFVDIANMADVQFGLIPTADVHGLALMSDGGAEKLVAHDGNRVASRLGTWLEGTAQETLTADKIALAYHEPEMWERTSQDDCSIVLVARPSAR